MRRRFLAIVASGIGSTRAAVMAGVHPDTVAAWCKANPDFARELDEARERCLASLEEIVHKAAKRDWHAATWLLERRLPREYSRQATLPQPNVVTLESVLMEIHARRQAQGTHTLPACTTAPQEGVPAPQDRLPVPTLGVSAEANSTDADQRSFCLEDALRARLEADPD